MVKLKACLIGLGGVADRIHFPALQTIPEIGLVGACDINPEQRKRAQEKWKISNLYTEAEEMLELCKPDFAIIGTPPDSHHDMCMLALRNGAHVFCEKPFVVSIEEADEVIALAEKTRRSVSVNNQYRYMQMYRIAGEKIRAGEYGKPHLAQCWQQMYHPPAFEKNWRAKLQNYTLFEFGTHALDLLCYFFDDYPESVFAQIPHPNPEFESDVIAAVFLRFPRERIATLVFNRISHAPERYFEMRFDCSKASIRISLGGVARASIDWSATLKRPIIRSSFVKGGEARMEKGGKSRIIAHERRNAFASATAFHLREFIQNLNSQNFSTVPAQHARRLLDIVFSAYESAESGAFVTLNSAVKQIRS